MMNCYIFDIDGTLADNTHRSHHLQKTPKDWKAFWVGVLDDKPIAHMVRLCQILQGQNMIIFVSGRVESLYKETRVWLISQGLYVNRMLLRKDGDFRDDAIIKSEVLDKLLAEGYKPIMAFDDRTKVVKMWRERGIPCAQVAEGDF